MENDIKRYMAQIGRKGGKAVSKAKAKASRKSLAKARAILASLRKKKIPPESV